MKTILIIYIIISLLNFIVTYLLAKSVVYKFHKNNPDIKFKKISSFERIVSWIRQILISFIPILNFIMLITYLIAWDIIAERIEERVWKEMVDE